jgi:NAD(P)-dependent dehydrogenase (short-subunit alcohol dehydrogenase family)
VACDVAREADVDELARQTLDRFGQVDVLVNNAGVTHVAPALDEPLEQFRETIDINLTGAYLCARSLGRNMVERRPRLHHQCGLGDRIGRKRHHPAGGLRGIQRRHAEPHT